MFRLISSINADRRHQMYCDGSQHVQIVFPAHEYSGEACGVEATDCQCAKPDDLSPSLRLKAAQNALRAAT